MNSLKYALYQHFHLEIIFWNYFNNITDMMIFVFNVMFKMDNKVFWISELSTINWYYKNHFR